MVEKHLVAEWSCKGGLLVEDWQILNFPFPKRLSKRSYQKSMSSNPRHILTPEIHWAERNEQGEQVKVERISDVRLWRGFDDIDFWWLHKMTLGYHHYWYSNIISNFKFSIFSIILYTKVDICAIHLNCCMICLVVQANISYIS